MKQVSLVLLASLIFLGSLMPQIDMDELTKIPYLLNHYAEHCSEGQNIDFLEFLALHYDDTEHSKSPEHKKMPFFHHEVANLLFIIFETVEVQLPSIEQKVTHYFASSSSYTFVSSIKLFQPPKVS